MPGFVDDRRRARTMLAFHPDTTPLMFPHITEELLAFYSWPQLFHTSTGPHGGAFIPKATYFQIEAYVDLYGRAVVFCDGRPLKVVFGFEPMNVELAQ